jgi:diaminopimelate epimerase
VELFFDKYQGTGNDFIMLNNLDGKYDLDKLSIPALCDRRFGIGADGLIAIQKHKDTDFEMIYFNSDGSQSFCGNGSRCAVKYAKSLGIIDHQTRFLSTDGIHEASIYNDEISLKMHDLNSWEKGEGYYFANTGSPHHIVYKEGLQSVSINEDAKGIRFSPRYTEQGVNVNFVENTGIALSLRTYERGVEDETLSCGTGVTAVVLMDHIHHAGPKGEFVKQIQTQGGMLKVKYQFIGDRFTDVWLIGPAEYVYSGRIII